MTPFRGIAQPGIPEERFNNTLTTVRNTIERCNGLLKNRFRCLLKDRCLHYQPLKASKIINACAVLHNMCMQRNIPLPDDEHHEHLEEVHVNIEELEEGENNELNLGRLLQRSIINNHFA